MFPSSRRSNNRKPSIFATQVVASPFRTLLVIMLLTSPVALAAESGVSLIDGLGNHEYEITADNEAAQQYFNQGMRLYYAFNHPEAIRSFREAQRLDPSCAMCFWGESLAWGPNINLPMDADAGEAAYKAVQ